MLRRKLLRGALIAAAVLLPATDLAAASAVSAATAVTSSAVSSADPDRTDRTDRTPGPARAARGHRSDLPWRSGVFAHDTGVARSFERMRGSKVDLVSVHPQRDSWQTLRDPWWLRQTAGIRRDGASLEITMPLWPNSSSVYENARKQWRSFGRLLVRRGERDAIITIGKEFNLPNAWHINAGNRDAWRLRFRQAVRALRAVRGERFTIAWTPNEGPSQTGVSPLAAWPGRKYVDVVAPDYYDQWSPIRTWAQAHQRFNRKFGIEWWFRWAERRGVRVGVSEWGVSSGYQWGDQAGGDNPFYVKAMHRLFKRYQDRLVYESYFEEPEAYVASSLVSQNPRARRAYRRLWS